MDVTSFENKIPNQKAFILKHRILCKQNMSLKTRFGLYDNETSHFVTLSGCQMLIEIMHKVHKGSKIQ